MNIRIINLTCVLLGMFLLGGFAQKITAQDQDIKDVLAWAGFDTSNAVMTKVYTVDQAKNLLIGKWKYNAAETRKLPVNKDIEFDEDPIGQMDFSKAGGMIVTMNGQESLNHDSFELKNGNTKNEYFINIPEERFSGEITLINKNRIRFGIAGSSVITIWDREKPAGK